LACGLFHEAVFKRQIDGSLKKDDRSVTSRQKANDKLAVTAMPATREIPSIAAWSQDRLDSPVPPENEPAYFDEALEAWVLSRHADILAALRAPGLATASSEGELSGVDDIGARMRAEAVEALNPAQINRWREELEPECAALAATLRAEAPVDLIAEYARPLCLASAAIVSGVSRELAHSFEPNTRRISVATADPEDDLLREHARHAAKELGGCFSSGPKSLRELAFVALSQTMPCLLGSAWFGLIEHPRQWSLLHLRPELTAQAIEELLRYAGLTRTLSRRASSDLDLNGVTIRAGERVVLRIFAANRDPARFAQPNQVEAVRRDGGHLTLGAGKHACVAANLIRTIAIAVTLPLVRRFAGAVLGRPVDWQGGSGFRYPKSLWVHFPGSPESER
jgi:cytochrome P450